jgi:heterodisulfide reductase subunit B
VVCCPLCHVNLDLKQAQINSYLGTEYEVPILYLPQVLGIAFGLSPEDVMLSKNVVDPEPLIKRALAEAAETRAEEERKAAEKAAKAAARKAKTSPDAATVEAAANAKAGDTTAGSQGSDEEARP